MKKNLVVFPFLAALLLINLGQCAKDAPIEKDIKVSLEDTEVKQPEVKKPAEVEKAQWITFDFGGHFERLCLVSSDFCTVPRQQRVPLEMLARRALC